METRAAGDSVFPDHQSVQRPFLAQKKSPRSRIALFLVPPKSNESGLYLGLLCRFLGLPVWICILCVWNRRLVRLEGAELSEETVVFPYGDRT